MNQTQEEFALTRHTNYLMAATRAAQDAAALATAVLESLNQGSLHKDYEDACAITDVYGRLMASTSVLLAKSADFDPKRIEVAREKHARQWLKRLGVDWR